MKTILFSLIFIFCVTVAFAQPVGGSYNSTGYFYHPTSPRYLGSPSTLTVISANVYEVQLGDLAGYSFRFSLDVNNNVINWVPLGSTPAVPSSGFMTADNPGGFSFPGAPSAPGASPFKHSTYNNTYNPVTKTFYLHYGYAVGAASQNDFTRQVYQQLVYQPVYPVPVINSVSPLAVTALTAMTIKGSGFTDVGTSENVLIGGTATDSAAVLSDTVIMAWPALGSSGPVTIYPPAGSGTGTSAQSVTYTSVPAVVDTVHWKYLGSAGFSSNTVYNANVVFDRLNNPYAVYIDSVTRRGTIRKYGSGNWTSVAPDFSDSLYFAKLLFDHNNNMIAAGNAYRTNIITVKKFDGSNWVDLGLPAANGPFQWALDRNDHIYLVNVVHNKVTISAYNGSSWTVTGTSFKSYIYDIPDVAVDTVTNTPYIIYGDSTTEQANLIRLSGGSWNSTGTANFSTGVRGMYNPLITIDNASNPVVEFQEDNGFERLSAYRLSGGTWSPVGYPFFSQAHSYNPSLVLDKFNNPFTVFEDVSYNSKGTVRSYSTVTGRWDTIGRRGFLPCQFFDRNALAVSPENNILLAFADADHAGKISVMQLHDACYGNVNTWTGAVSHAWENPANWSCGTMPGTGTNVILPPGAIVVLSTAVTIHSLTLQSNASFTVAPGVQFIITNP